MSGYPQATEDQAGAEHRALIALDEIIGVRAELQTARIALGRAQQELADANRSLAELGGRHEQLERQAAQAASLRRELDEIKGSEAWRVGNALARSIGRLRPGRRAS